MQPTRDLIGIRIEFAARVQHGHDYFGRRDALLFVHIHRYAAAIVTDSHAAGRVNDYVYLIAKSGQRFVDGVVNQFLHHVMQPSAVFSVTYIHARALLHGLKSLKNLNVSRIVVVVRFGHEIFPLFAMFHVEHPGFAV